MIISDEDLSDFLLKAVINFQPEDDCKKAYSSDQNLKAGFDFKTMICAGDRYTGKDTCSVMNLMIENRFFLAMV